MYHIKCELLSNVIKEFSAYEVHNVGSLDEDIKRFLSMVEDTGGKL